MADEPPTIHEEPTGTPDATLVPTAAPPGVTIHVPGRILTLADALTKNECEQLVAEADNAGFKPSARSGGGHGQIPQTGARTSQFRVVDSPKLAEQLWARCAAAVPSDLHGIKPVPYMPNQVTRGDEFKPVGCNPHIRFYKYDPGQFVLKHDDYRMSRFRRDSATGEYFQQMTFLTLLVYLNDEFIDGKTKFWTQYATTESKGHCRFIRDVDFAEADLAITPVTGMALINDHMVQHEGEAPQKGTKYILRSDIVHERPVPAERVTDKFKKGMLFGEWTRHYEPSCLHYTE